MAFIAKQRYKLDISPKGGWVIVYASQHDDGAREIEFAITNQGNAFSIPASINVSVQGIKANHSYFSHSCSYSGNIVTMALADDMTDIIGQAICVLKFTNSSQQKLATAKFILNVDSDSSSEGIIIDTEAEEIFNQMLNDIRAQAASISADIAELQSMVGSPLVASTASKMADHNKIYVYTGSESGYTNGNWYYWNGSAWTSGGIYNSTAVNIDSVPTQGSTNAVSSGGVYDALRDTDTTLTESGQAADAKVVGDNIEGVRSKLDEQFKITPTIISNGFVRRQDGGITTNADYSYTDYIPLMQDGLRIGLVIKTSLHQSTAIALYDADYNFLSAISSETTRNVPVTEYITDNTNAYYVRFTIPNAYITKYSVDRYLGYYALDKKVNDKIDAIASSVSSLENKIIYDNNIIDVSANTLMHTVGDGNITFDGNNGFNYQRVTVGNNQFGFTFPTQGQKRYTLTLDVDSIIGESGKYVKIIVSPTSAYNESSALASSDEIVTAKTVTLTFTAITAESSLWFGARRYTDSTKISNIVISDNILRYNQYIMEYDGSEVSTFNKILCIGDSITEGTFNYTDSDTNDNVLIDYRYSYPTILTKLTGVTTSNMGHGGYTAVEWYARHSADDLSGYDCAIVGFGINDSFENVSLADFTSAYHNIIDKLTLENKGIPVFVTTIIPAYTDYNRRFDPYNAEIRRIAEEDYSNVYLIDLTKYSVCKYGTAYEQGHLTAVGYAQMAKEIATLISYTIHSNLADFRNVQFIGTEYSYL